MDLATLEGRVEHVHLFRYYGPIKMAFIVMHMHLPFNYSIYAHFTIMDLWSIPSFSNYICLAINFTRFSSNHHYS